VPLCMGPEDAGAPLIIVEDEAAQVFGEGKRGPFEGLGLTEETVRKLMDQRQRIILRAWTDSRAARAEAPQAAQERRCVSPPMGCGQPLEKASWGYFRNETSEREYGITGMCQRCQDRVFAPPAELSIDEIHELERDERMFRCSECGEYREYDEVDVGVGVMRGENCCPLWDERYVRLPRCSEVPDCQLGEGHRHGHAVVDMHKHRCLVCHRYYAPEGQPQRCACRFESPED
jgi:hypothetical protein